MQKVLRTAWCVSVQCMLVTVSGGTQKKCPAWGALFFHLTFLVSLCFSEQFLDHFVHVKPAALLSSS